MTKEQRKILIGMEVESSNLSAYSATTELKNALRDVDMDMDWWNDCATGTNASDNLRRLPTKLRIPDNWTKSVDGSCGMENKFTTPTDSIEEAEKRVDDLTAWFDRTGIRQFRNAGTHVHLGVLDWITKYVDEVRTSTLGQRARALLYGYFITRERALFQLVPASRKSNDYCSRAFSARAADFSIGTPLNIMNATTPTWAIHNALLMYGAQVGGQVGLGGAIMNQRHLPTFEFRMFPGCGSPVALKGYVRLVWAMFQNVAPLILENSALRSKTSRDNVFVTNPLTFTAKDLKSELSDNWLKTWIDETLENDGSPITKDISSSREPQRLATV